VRSTSVVMHANMLTPVNILANLQFSILERVRMHLHINQYDPPNGSSDVKEVLDRHGIRSENLTTCSEVL
jgi:hypothetical protein